MPSGPAPVNPSLLTSLSQQVAELRAELDRVARELADLRRALGR